MKKLILNTVEIKKNIKDSLGNTIGIIIDIFLQDENGIVYHMRAGTFLADLKVCETLRPIVGDSPAQPSQSTLQTVIITRHAGLVAWLAERGITGQVIDHATPDDVRGKHVVGALPLHLAALAERITVVDLPGLATEQRGKDLTPTEMDAAGASLETYRITKVEQAKD